MSEMGEANPGRVMIVAASNRRRGAEVFSESLTGGLKRRGWEIDLVSLSGSSGEPTIRSSVLTTPSTSKFDTNVLRALRGRVRRTEPNVLLAMGGSTLRYSTLSTRGRPLVYFAIGEPDYWLKSTVSIVLNRFLLRQCRLILAVSRATGDQLRRLEPAIADRVTHSPTGVLVADDDPPPRAGNELINALFVGSLSDEKDPEMAVASVAAVPGISLRIVGSGPMEHRVRSMIAERGLAERVELVGPVEDVVAHYRWADILLLTSKTEGLPGVILEAAANRVPTVGVDVGGVAEAVENGVTGMVVDRSIDSVSMALTTIVGDPGICRRMGEKAADRMRREFSLDGAFDRFDAALRGVLG